VTSYYAVVEKPYESKNEEKPLKTDKEIALSAENNNKSKDNDSTITTIQTEKGTIMGPNTAPADDGKDLEQDKKKKAKNKEEVEGSGEEDEDGSPDELNFKNENKSTDEQQETYFKTGPEKATNIEANKVLPSDGVAGLRKHVEKFHAIGAIESKRTEELENVEKTNVEKNVEDLENEETEEDDTKNSVAGNN